MPQNYYNIKEDTKKEIKKRRTERGGELKHNICCMDKVKGKGKVIPITGLCGLEGG